MIAFAALLAFQTDLAVSGPPPPAPTATRLCEGEFTSRFQSDFNTSPTLINGAPVRVESGGEIPSGDASSLASIQFEGGTAEDRRALISPAPDRQPPDGALAFELRRPYISGKRVPATKGRVQLNLYSLPEARHVHMRVQAYLPAALRQLENYPDAFDWLTLSEWWNNAPWKRDARFPFRITLNLAKPDAAPGTPLRFAVTAQSFDPVAQAWTPPVWKETNDAVEVPIGSWFSIDLDLVEGNAATGRFILKVTDGSSATRTVFDVRHFTHHPDDPSPDGFSEANPLKLYTSARLIRFMELQGSSLSVYWDNLDFQSCK